MNKAEMIAELNKHPEKKFKCNPEKKFKCMELIYYSKGYDLMVSDGTDTKKSCCSVIFDNLDYTEYIETPKEVPFMEAVKLYNAGTFIRSHVEGHSDKVYNPILYGKNLYGNSMRSVCGHVISPKEITEGKWYVLEAGDQK